jgi:hypothetical protein
MLIMRSSLRFEFTTPKLCSRFHVKKTDDGKKSEQKEAVKTMCTVNAWLHFIQRFLQMLLNINELHFFTQCAKEGSKLMAIKSLEVAMLGFLEIDDMPNGFEVLRDHHSVKR